MDSNQRFVLALVEQFAEYESLLQEHLRDNDELLPYVFLASIATTIERAFESSSTERVQQLFEWIGRQYDESEPGVQNLISVGFVESLPSSDESAEIPHMLRGSLRGEYERVNW